MRYPVDHKASARETLLRAGACSLKTCGFNGIGVDGLAAAADVTSGAFYSNFANKEAMLEAVIDAGLGEPFLSDTDSATRAEGRARLLGFLQEYISADHSARRCGRVRDARLERRCFARRAARQRCLPAQDDRADRPDCRHARRGASDRQRRAWSIVALMVGSIVIARGMPEQSQSRTAPLGFRAQHSIDVGRRRRRRPAHQRLDRLASRRIAAYNSTRGGGVSFHAQNRAWDRFQRAHEAPTDVPLVASSFNNLVGQAVWIGEHNLVATRHLDQPVQPEPAGHPGIAMTQPATPAPTTMTS